MFYELQKSVQIKFFEHATLNKKIQKDIFIIKVKICNLFYFKIISFYYTNLDNLVLF